MLFTPLVDSVVSMKKFVVIASGLCKLVVNKLFFGSKWGVGGFFGNLGRNSYITPAQNISKNFIDTPLLVLIKLPIPPNPPSTF
jgi:hypothetical protein